MLLQQFSTNRCASRRQAACQRSHEPVSSMLSRHRPHLGWQQQNSSSSRHVVCRALEQYMIDKLTAAERTYKELQLRMSDPDVAANATEFQKVRNVIAATRLSVS
jgi:hypothetical protein